MHGTAAVRAYWTRQFTLVDPRVEREGFGLDDEGRTVVDVHQVVRDPQGNLLADNRVQHVYTLRDGLVERMDVREPETLGKRGSCAFSLGRPATAPDWRRARRLNGGSVGMWCPRRPGSFVRLRSRVRVFPLHSASGGARALDAWAS